MTLSKIEQLIYLHCSTIPDIKERLANIGNHYESLIQVQNVIEWHVKAIKCNLSNIEINMCCILNLIESAIRLIDNNFRTNRVREIMIIEKSAKSKKMRKQEKNMYHCYLNALASVLFTEDFIEMLGDASDFIGDYFEYDTKKISYPVSSFASFYQVLYNVALKMKRNSKKYTNNTNLYRLEEIIPQILDCYFKIKIPVRQFYTTRTASTIISIYLLSFGNVAVPKFNNLLIQLDNDEATVQLYANIKEWTKRYDKKQEEYIYYIANDIKQIIDCEINAIDNKIKHRPARLTDYMKSCIKDPIENNIVYAIRLILIYGHAWGVARI